MDIPEIPLKEDFNISELTESNYHKFMTCLIINECLEENDNIDVIPSGYDTVVIDINNDNGLVSLEIGHKQIGFFTDFREGNNLINDGKDTDFTSIPNSIEKALKRIHNR